MTDLDRLIEAVVDGKWSHDAASKWLWRKDGKFYGWANDAFKGDLNAAMALHEALLPGWVWKMETHGTLNFAWVSRPSEMLFHQYQSALDNPARAWLLAILKAYRSQQ